MWSHRSLVIALCSAALGWATLADARVVTTTYSGKVFGGFDLTGMFVQPGGQFAGEDFTATFRIDLAPPQNCYVSSQKDDISSSARVLDDLGCAPDFLGFTIAGHSLGLGGVNFIAQSQFDDGSFESFSHSLTSNNRPIFGHTRLASVALGGDGTDANFLSGPVWTSLTTAQAMRAPRLHGSFQFLERGGAGEVYRDTWGTLVPGAVTVDSGVLEPATWTLMILGFAAAGSAIRRAGRWTAD